MRIHSLRKIVLAAFAAAAFVAAPVASSAIVFTFDDVSDLSEYDIATFGSGSFIWDTDGHISVLSDPNATHYSTEDVLCVGLNCQGSVDITFAQEFDFVSVVALSGPGPDLLGQGVMLEAFDKDGNLLGTDVADTSLQFDTLRLEIDGIASIRLTGSSDIEVFDDLQATMPEPTAALLFGLGIGGVALRQRRR